MLISGVTFGTSHLRSYSIIFRYFESGVFKGFFKNFGNSLFLPLMESLDDQIDDVCYMATYSDWDVEACLDYRTLDSRAGRKGIFPFFQFKMFLDKIFISENNFYL